MIEKATIIAENAWDYSEKLSALNTITKAIQAAARITGLESAPAITNNTLTINEAELVKNLSIYRNGRSVKEV